jgi:hypothetical protein
MRRAIRQSIVAPLGRVASGWCPFSLLDPPIEEPVVRAPEVILIREEPLGAGTMSLANDCETRKRFREDLLGR